MNRLVLIFDWDETLVHTKELVVEAYVRAGVDRDEVLKHWGKPWTTWLQDRVSIHNQKQVEFLKLVKERGVKLTELGRAVTANRHPRLPFNIITGASYDSFQAVFMSMIRTLDPIVLLGTSLSADKKHHTIEMHYISKWIGKYDSVIYFDDDLQSGLTVIDRTEHLLAYYKAEEETITIYTNEGHLLEWIPSFLLRELTNALKGSSLRITNHFSS